MATALSPDWAGLYGAWAIAILFKVPLLTFPEQWAGAEVFVGVAGTGLITGLIAHIYNRHALRKLKRLTSMEQDGGDTDEKAE